MTAFAASLGCRVDILRISAVALVGLVALLVLRQLRPEWASLLRLGLTVILVGLLLSAVDTVVDFASDLGGEVSLLPEGMWQALLKALGISVITEVAAGMCRDVGETGVATWVEAAGKLEILVLSLPLISEILTVARELLSVS